MTDRHIVKIDHHIIFVIPDNLIDVTRAVSIVSAVVVVVVKHKTFFEADVETYVFIKHRIDGQTT